ncbi:MAG: Gldg family protein, partial [Clostridia bacterium]|nr:Gldg family protein [Deltaproteobacteria bacterium]
VLKSLDAEMQTKLIKAVRPARIVYFTTGHGERDTAQATPDGRSALNDFKQLLDAQGFSQKRYGLAEGSSGDVPNDATLVVVAGATQGLLQSELDGLQAYLNKGGRLLLLSEAGDANAMQPVASLVGVTLGKAPVAATQNRVRMKDRGDSPYFWATGSVPPHASQETLSKAGGRAPLVIINGCAVTKKTDAAKELTITGILKSGVDAWEDANGNGTAEDPSEKRGQIEIAQAVEEKVASAAADTKPARAIIVGDTDMAANGVLSEVQGNAVFFIDGLRWLAGDDTISGQPATEKDVPILHRKEQDSVWFFGTSFLVPAIVLGAGLTMSKRARRSRSSQDNSNG